MANTQTKNILSIGDCYGCGVCASVCPKQIISLKLNKDGFYRPFIENLESCLNCGICLSACSFNDAQTYKHNNQPVAAYAGWSRDEKVRYTSASGGIGHEIAKDLIHKGYKICLCKYNIETERSEHYIAENEKELEEGSGSKYQQSYSPTGFKKLNKHDKFAVFGTPCQIDSLRRWTSKMKCENNFIFIDFFCHGTPSMLLWEKYLQHCKKKISNIKSVAWRNKLNGWHDSWAMTIGSEIISNDELYANASNKNFFTSKKFIYSRLSKGDMFYALFLGNMCFQKSCYESCKFKALNSSADIRLGDLWGNKYSEEEKGVTGVIALTEQGNSVLQSIQNIELIRESTNTITEDQLTDCCKRPIVAKIAMKLLKSNLSLRFIYMSVYLPHRLISLIIAPSRIYNYLRKKINKLIK